MVRRTVFVVGLAIAVAAVAIWPAFQGYHLGRDNSTDNACKSWVIQWCKHKAPASDPNAHKNESVGPNGSYYCTYGYNQAAGECYGPPQR